VEKIPFDYNSFYVETFYCTMLRLL